MNDYIMGLKTLYAIFLSRFGKKTPLHVLHHITERCNLRCKYCETWSNESSELDTETIKKIMEEFQKLGTMSWGFGGAEPLLRNDIGELIDHAKRLRFRVSVATNGYFVKDNIDALRKIDLMVLSLDGPREINDYYRGEGSYDTALMAIKTTIENNIRVIINTAISNKNIENIMDVVELAKELGCEIGFQPIYFGKDKVDNKNSFFEYDLYPRVIEQLIEKKREGYPIVSSESYLRLIKNWPNKSPKKPCYAGKLYFALMPDGILKPCGHDKNRGVSVIRYGVKEAIEKLEQPSCIGCFSNCYQDLNLAFSLKLEAVNNARKYL